MSDFTFKKGTFVQLKANSTIHLGRLERNIYEGDIVEFDGFSLKFSGQTTDMPELKAGLKRGWLSLFEGDVAEPVVETVSEPAPAKKEMPVQTVYDEERQVAEVSPPKEEQKKKFPLVVESQDDDIISVAKVENKSGADISGASSASDGVAEAQGAESVSSIKLKTSANTKTVISDGSQASAEISKLDNMEAPVSKTASTEEVVEEEEEDPFAELLELEEEPESEEPESSLAEEQDLENAQILQAIDGDVDPAQGVVAVGKDNSKIKVLPGGIEWDTSKHWSKRAKIAIEMYGDSPEVLKSIMEVETKGVVTAIQKMVFED